MSENKLCIFDTTLRDGEQSPGINLNQSEKIQIAEMLEDLKVDVIEAGFASASQGDFNSIKAIASNIKDSTVCSLCRATDNEVDMTAEALKPAVSGRIHIVLSTSDLHMKHKLQMSPQSVLELGVRAVKRARQYSDNVEFSCEDASRSDLDFLSKFVELIIAAGATTVSLPDTVGYALPADYAAMITTLRNNVVNADKAVFSAHCHNDLGLAVANSLAAIEAGARQVECTINGIGERAGNASLEEIVMATITRKDRFDVHTRVQTNRLLAASRLVSDITGFTVQPNKAIVGRNAFSHESGIHQDGMLKDRNTYQIMEGADVGWTGSSIVLGKHSGRSGFQTYMKMLGIEFNSKDQLNSAFNEFKHLTDHCPRVSDEQLVSICGHWTGE